jgi:hypothetical protein
MVMINPPGGSNKRGVTPSKTAGNRAEVGIANDKKLQSGAEAQATALKVLDQLKFPKELAKIVVND